MIKITVPATSANLGIGYDTLGMAVSLYSHFTFERADKLTITGCPEEFQNENNLVYVSFVDALAAWGEPAFPVAIDIQTDVPVARGLPKNAKNVSGAEKFINFMCSTEAAMANWEYIGYSSPQTEVYKELDEEITGDPLYFPDITQYPTEAYTNLPTEINQFYNDLWVDILT